MTKLTMLFAILSLLFLLGLVACDGFDTNIDDTLSGQDADVVRGELLFNQPTIGSASAPGCVTCHSLEPGVVIVGPSQAGLASRAAQTIPGMTASDYLRASIVEPDAHVVEGFSAGVMYQNYGTDLTADEIDALVAFMMTLE